MISIGVSMTLYPKPMGWKYAGGLASTVAGLWALYLLKRRKLLAAGGGERRRHEVTTTGK